MAKLKLKKANSSLKIDENNWNLVELRKKQFLKGEITTISLKDIRKKASKHLKK
jgi:hypothetical protein